MTASPKPHPTLLVFARYPREGSVKTRLAAAVGAGRALRIYRAMLLDSLERLSDFAAGERRLLLSGCSEQEGRELLAQSGCLERYQVRVQVGADLGARIVNAVLECGRREEGYLIMGADSPTVPLSYLRRACRWLSEVPVVIGPARDGGYYLLALRDLRTDLLEGIEWGSDRVLEQTISRIRPSEYRLLPHWYDVDTVDDLELVRNEISGSPQWRGRRLQAVLAAPNETSGAVSAPDQVRTDLDKSDR